eukprot:357482-Chlamydomonas_euryale.AAC.4
MAQCWRGAWPQALSKNGMKQVAFGEHNVRSNSHHGTVACGSTCADSHRGAITRATGARFRSGLDEHHRVILVQVWDETTVGVPIPAVRQVPRLFNVCSGAGSVNLQPPDHNMATHTPTLCTRAQKSHTTRKYLSM